MMILKQKERPRPGPHGGALLRLRATASVRPGGQASAGSSEGDSIIRVWERHGVPVVPFERVRSLPRVGRGGRHRRWAL